ncbi:uncharacterized protein LOC126713453 [Quercus robur]|uniref:uncharacterized protein LOC126713453 n=1 Tax=Quercus robur TaxID=38942 RepID=UPI00216202A1|nr:uncharacterized protein LOC126713453 [Quercus robur]
MVRLIPQHRRDHFGSMPLAIGLFFSVMALVALCAKHSRRARKDYEDNDESNDSFMPKKSSPLKSPSMMHVKSISNKANQFITNSPKSPLLSSKKIVTIISNKANTFMYKKKGGGHDFRESEGEGEGEGGLWQKSILMGDKCRPPAFSGVIHYDSFGNMLSEPPPRSPRVGPFQTVFMPEIKNAN